MDEERGQSINADEIVSSPIGTLAEESRESNANKNSDAVSQEDDLENVEEKLQKFVTEVQGKMDSKDAVAAFNLIDRGTSFAKHKALSQNARHLYAQLYVLKSKLLYNPFNLLPSMDGLDLAIWVSKTPNIDLIDFCAEIYPEFLHWCRSYYFVVHQQVVSFFEKKVRWLEKLLENDPIHSAASIFLYSNQCCQLAEIISTLDRRRIGKSVLIELFVRHGYLQLEQDKISNAKIFVERAFEVTGNCAKMHLLSAKVSFCLLKSLQPSHRDFTSLCREIEKHIRDGLDITSTYDTGLEKDFHEMKKDFKDYACQNGVTGILSELSNCKTEEEETSDSECPEIVKVQQRQQERQEKARQAYLNRQAKNKPKLKHVNKQRTSLPLESLADGVEKGPSKAQKTDSKSKSGKSVVKKEAETKCLINTPNGIYKVDIKETKALPISVPKSKLRKESRISREVYSFLVQKYRVHLGCDCCIYSPNQSDNSQQKVMLRTSGHHSCLENKLLLRELPDGRSSEWLIIRPCPRRFNLGGDSCGLCESFVVGDECMEKNLCPFPHSNEEMELWQKFFKTKIPMQKFIDDLRETPLRVKYDVERLCESFNGLFKFICDDCYTQSNGQIIKNKKHHSPFCENEEDCHAWNDDNQKFVFVRNGSTHESKRTIPLDDLYDDDSDDDDDDDDDSISSNGSCIGKRIAAIKIQQLTTNLLNIGVKRTQIIEESKRFWQKREKLGSFTSDFQVMYERVRDDSISSGNGSSVDPLQHSPDSDVEEDPDKVYDSDLDDVMTVHDSDEEDVISDEEQEDDGFNENLYYELKPHDELRRLLEEEPQQFKRCLIFLDGPCTAKCKVLDSKIIEDIDSPNEHGVSKLAQSSPISESEMLYNRSCHSNAGVSDNFESNDEGNHRVIEIRGRANCGPCFSGDEVVVELKKTKELGDDAAEVYRGTVVGILKRRTDRRAYTFLCHVDMFMAHLMRPINGLAPKIHVVHSVIKTKHAAQKNELVAKYHLEDGELKLDKIVKLDPKRRRDMLFVVKYLRWQPNCMYPLGYVTKIIQSGSNLEDSQKVLNILYQVPTMPNKNCHEAAQELLAVGRGETEFTDITHWFTVSIDPSDCKDVDDALTIRRIENGFEAGVHIADVSQFVEMDGVIDNNARKRVTSYYSADSRVFHMLPAELSENLCSLKENEERLALSVFVILSPNADILNRGPIIKRTVIKNKKNMTYEEAQAYIDTYSPAEPNFSNITDVKSAICTLHFLAKQLRSKRLKLGQFFYQDDDPFTINKCHDAHRLVEEFMILANIQIANFLISKFPDCTPLRRQVAPKDEDLEQWFEKNQELMKCSFYFNQFNCLTEKTDWTGLMDASTNYSLLMSTVEKLKAALKRKDLREIKTIVGNEWLHPDHALAMIEWWGILEQAEFIPSGDLDDMEPDHFSLQVPYYVQFTSPIRRYMDIVIHRLVKCALDREPSPYALSDVRKFCHKVNNVNRIAKKYHKACHLLKLTDLLSKPFYLPCFVENFDDDGLTLTIPHLGKVKKNRRMVKYSALSVNDKPDIKNKVELLWEKRLYDADERSQFKPSARRRHNARRVMRIESNRHIGHAASSQWFQLLDAVSNNEETAMRKSIESIMEDISQEKQCRTERTEVTSEMYNNELMVKHHVRFSLSLERGSVLAVQLGAECCDGFLQPAIRMVNLTPEKDICVEHRADPVKCFAGLATEKVRPDYQSIDHYQSIFLPILAMEAASKTVAQGDTIHCNNVTVSLKKMNNEYYGKLELPLMFCKKRKIHIFNNSKDGEEDSNDFLCIRYHTHQDKVCETKDSVCSSFIRNIWVGHAVALYVHVDKKQDVIVKFRLQQFNSEPPRSFLDAGKSGVSCAVEFLTKLLPDRRMEDAVKSVDEASDLCKKIVLGHRIDDLPEITKYVQDDTYDIEVAPSAKIYKNNKDQTDAIRKSLQGKFTLIQGPPGTGKTVTGIKVAYWFVETNKKMRKDGGTHGQVLYCGPSNSSVDVAAKWLKNLGKKCPKIVRVYSEVLERQVFPIPRDSLQIGNLSGRHYELIDKDDNKDIALHHLIRMKEKKFSAKIRACDKLFAEMRDSPEEISDEKIEEYKKLITDAAINELKEYDIILCTCAASVSPRMLRSANVRQIIIDECGMCMEPETLIPLQGFKHARQFVLIGDHKQLQPIVTNSVARNLGLDVSLFERYKDRAIMLTEQYRMHPRICEFPSIQFYEKKLKTAENHDCVNERKYRFWPNRYIPMVFCHAEGAEKVLSVSTEEGNEHSRSNELERKEAVRIFFNLVNYYKVDPDRITILSQYKAQCSDIEQNLKGAGYEHPNVGTVIASQGDEWDYVILSLVRSMPEYEIEKKPSIGWCQKNMGFIIDEHQINVALTRARLGLIIIGNKHLLRCNEMWKNLLYHFENRKLIMDTNDFLPSANRLGQRPPNENDAQMYDRFGNRRDVQRDSKPFGYGAAERQGQTRSYQDRDNRGNDSFGRKPFSKPSNKNNFG